MASSHKQVFEMGSFQLERKAVASVSVKHKDSADLYFLLTPQTLQMRSG